MLGYGFKGVSPSISPIGISITYLKKILNNAWYSGLKNGLGYWENGVRFFAQSTKNIIIMSIDFANNGA